MAACNCGSGSLFQIVRNGLGQTVTVNGSSGRFYFSSCGVTRLRYSIQRQGIEVAGDVIQNVSGNNYYIDLIGLSAGTYNFVLTSEIDSNGNGCTGTDSGNFTISWAGSTTNQMTTTQPLTTTVPVTTTIPNLNPAIAVNDVIKGGQIDIPQVVDVIINDIPCTNDPEFYIEDFFGCIVTPLLFSRFQVIPKAKTWYFKYSIYCDGNRSSDIATVVGTVTEKTDTSTILDNNERYNISSIRPLSFSCVDGFLTVNADLKNNASISIKTGSKIRVLFNGISGQFLSNVGEIKNGYLEFNKDIEQDEVFSIIAISPRDCTQPATGISICLQI